MSLLTHLFGKNSPMTTTTVDVHTHFIPQSYIDALQGVGVSAKEVGFPLDPWDKAQRLEVMEQNGIATEIISLSSPGLRYFPGAEAVRLCHGFNDELAELMRDQPKRFGGLATLPLPNVDASLAEIARACDELKLDGIILMTNYDSLYPGDPKFAPVLEELNRREAVVFLHPTETVGNAHLTFGYPAPMVEYPAETTRTVVNLLDTETITHYPKIRWIVSHGGGTLPLLMNRLEKIFSWKRHPDKEQAAKQVAEQVASIYWDMAIVCYEAPLLAIQASHPADKLVSAFDLPYFPLDQVAVAKENLAKFKGFTDDEKQAIDHGTAHRLFPRVAQANAK